jgi:hypothetical protein
VRKTKAVIGEPKQKRKRRDVDLTDWNKQKMATFHAAIKINEKLPIFCLFLLAFTFENIAKSYCR